MQAILDFMSNTWFIVAMVVILLALIGLFFFMRSRQSED
jgi:LPXTG-motif cell wall-anchored protein